jgi:hypothetical protein
MAKSSRVLATVLAARTRVLCHAAQRDAGPTRAAEAVD